MTHMFQGFVLRIRTGTQRPTPVFRTSMYANGPDHAHTELFGYARLYGEGMSSVLFRLEAPQGTGDVAGYLRDASDALMGTRQAFVHPLAHVIRADPAFAEYHARVLEVRDHDDTLRINVDDQVRISDASFPNTWPVGSTNGTDNDASTGFYQFATALITF